MVTESPLPIATDRILLVDAAVDEREMYALELRRSGYDVSECLDGEEGLLEARRSHPSLIVTDVVLPKIGGLQFLSELRQQDTTRDIPVIVLMGYDQPVGIVAQAREAGAASVRIKPCLPATLLRDVQYFLHRSRELRARSAEARLHAEKARARAIEVLARAAHLTPRPCPLCGGELQPIASTRPTGRLPHSVHYRPCRNGCGSWYYDEAARRLLKLM
jgi:DNA-binding response OmpR family regulator